MVEIDWNFNSLTKMFYERMITIVIKKIYWFLEKLKNLVVIHIVQILRCIFLYLSTFSLIFGFIDAIHKLE